MSQRKLNDRQSRRAQQRQQKSADNLANKERDLSRQIQSGELSSEQAGLIICRYSKHFEVEALEGADQGKSHKCVTRTNLGTLVAGDKVIWRSGANQTGVIESKQQRSSLLQRPDNFGKLKAVAANIDQMLIVIASEPVPQPNLIDRYLVAAELIGVRPIIALNKTDLITNQNRESLEKLLGLYESLGYITLKIVSSRHQPAQLSNLLNYIDQRTSIIVGQSGVGKSSLINKLLPDAKLEVGDLSEQTREGTHTTTKAKLFHLAKGGQLIDSPGIRDFGLWHISTQELEQGFIDIAQHAGQCRFRDCQHNNEPSCAILQAVEQGDINQDRFQSFSKIKASILEQQARGLKLD